MSLLILFGTQTGNSELIAGELAETLDGAGYDAEVVDMADAYPEQLEEAEAVVAVVCTWSDGTFPDNAVAFWESLEAVAPDCSGLTYAVVGLGDRLYDPYYQVAAYRLADKLEALGARCGSEPYEIDGPVLPSHREALRRWVLRFAGGVERASGAASSPKSRT